MKVRKDLELTNLYQNECMKSKSLIFNDILENCWLNVFLYISGCFLLYFSKPNNEEDLLLFVFLAISIAVFMFFSFYSHYVGEMYIMEITVTNKKSSFLKNFGKVYYCYEGNERVRCTKNVYQQLNTDTKYKCFVKGNMILDVIEKIEVIY